MSTQFSHPASSGSGESSKRIPAGVCGILLGALGVHKFILGYTSEGAIMLVVSLIGFFLLGLGPLVMGIIGLIEGIIYLTKTPEEFRALYIDAEKDWF